MGMQPMGQTPDHGKVLVVEDDESAAVFVTRVLARAGFDSFWAADADEATSMLANDRYDVLLADFRLAGRSGLELVRKTRDAQPAVRIAVMTSFNETGLESRARSLGADDFFEKPLVPSILVSRIGHLADLSRSGAPHTAEVPRAIGTTRRSTMARGPRSAPLDTPKIPSDRSSGCEEAAKGHGSGHGDNAAPAAPPPLPGLGAVPLWTSAMPVVSHIASEYRPVTLPQTSAAWSFAD